MDKLMVDGKIKILYIAGLGRSGSTLLASLLGQVDGFMNVGEAGRFLFNARMQSRNLPCECGKSVSDCAFWKDLVPPEDTVRFATRFVSVRYFVRLVLLSRFGPFRKRLDALLAAQRTLYSHIALREGCRVIVDSSKHPASAYVLSLIPVIELYVLHLVRDARDVAASWSRPKQYLKPLSPWKVSLLWITHNLLAELVGLFAGRYLRIRYKDLVNASRDSLTEIIHFVGEGANEMLGSLGKEPKRHRHHALAGNPDKLAHGRRIRAQSPARTLPRRSELLVLLMTWPLLGRYGC